MACERNHIPKAEHEVVLRYLELLPTDCAFYLEDPVRVPREGWRLEPLMAVARAYFELREIYGGTGKAGGLQRQRRQNATWANDKKLMQTPLALRAPPHGSPKASP